MKLIGLIACAAIYFIVGNAPAQGQVAQQYLRFSIVGQYQINPATTNTATETIYQTPRMRGVYISSPNVIKAIAIDLEGKEWTNWLGSVLVREVNLATGAEGIFLRLGTNQTNVSAFFGDSFSNNFSADISSDLGGFTNLIYYDNGVETNITNSAFLGGLTLVSNSPPVTNRIESASLFSVSLNTSNLKFNLLAFGTTVGTNLVLTFEGANYSRWVDTLTASGVGNFAINLQTNLFYGANLFETTNFVSGPARGTFSCWGTVFSKLPGP